ncbi:hypothetical protein [Streptomyces sp. CB01580]|uniref:hypothetical protein n=1 Tax=Streptomyces sp. CB01580 TaxID=1703933 RepID=UPI0011613CF3|nr:hypothetical protein [Streptomyces sp. CB01580]
MPSRPDIASIGERPKKDGTTAYQVKWRQDGEWQSEKFGDSDSAKQFKNLVEAHGGQWPHSWVRGEGTARSRDRADQATAPGSEHTDVGPGQRPRLCLV